MERAKIAIQMWSTNREKEERYEEKDKQTKVSNPASQRRPKNIQKEEERKKERKKESKKERKKERGGNQESKKNSYFLFKKIISGGWNGRVGELLGWE